ncbi:MAG: gliding motility protein GldM [Flavobacteriaceae bacterium]|jgi:gliding motility-associated protein GldM|nr:gliding motility protein GldM [Flavobacteriaceae bacterium]
MAGGKQTPRQKMINLMYLVFIAMMAMNIDREVLRSFEGVNQSLLTASDLTFLNNEIFLQNIKDKKDKGEVGYVAIYPQAEQVKEEADKTYSMIQALKGKITSKVEYNERNNHVDDINYNSLQNIDASNKILFVSDNKITPEFQQVIDQVNKFKQFMLKGDPKSAERITRLFNFSDKNGKSWAVDKFYGQPMIATLSNLSTLQSNVRTEEGNRLRDLLSNKLQEQIELRAFQPIVASPKYVTAGEQFDVTVAFGAYDNTLRGSINLNGRSVPLTNGKSVIHMTASGGGVQSLNGSISYESNGKTVTQPFKETYEVVSNITRDASAVAVVVADKMNVVYRGVDNPLSAVVAGIDASAVNLSTSIGSLSRSGKGWVYRPGSGSEVTFTASGKTSTGKVISTPVKFRIKNVPKAQGQIRGENNVSMPASSLANQVITATIPDFEFPVTFTVTGFKVKVPGLATAVVSGSSLSAASGVLSKARSGDQVLVFDISATTTGSNQSNISPVVINVR